jgi:hypothetical protein
MTLKPVFSVLCLLGCAADRDSTTPGEDGSTEPGPVEPGPIEPTEPTATPLERAIAAAREAATWITFDDIGGGCSDRAALLSAAIASAGVPTNAQFITPAGEPRLTPRQHPGIEWHYHVAPVVFTTAAGRDSANARVLEINAGVPAGEYPDGAYVIDPALYPDEIAAPLAQWVADVTGQPQADVFISLGEGREAQDPPMHLDDARRDSRNVTIPAELAAMPRLWQFLVDGSCHFLTRDVGDLEPVLGPEVIGQIRDDMNRGAFELITRMQTQNLLEQSHEVSMRPCGF